MTPGPEQIALDHFIAPRIRTSSPRLLILRLLFLAAGFVLALLLVEVGLRFFSYADLHLWQWDDCLGWRGYAGAVGRSPESQNWVHLNSRGFHDREHGRRKPHDTLRIAVLGDSMTEATEVAVDKTFTAVLERELAPMLSANGKQVEVLNFGVRGYGTAQELLLLRREAWGYDPDIVVLAFFSGNDVSDNSPIAIAGHSPRPYFAHRDGKLVLDNSYIEREPFFTKLLAWGKLHIRVWQLAARAKASVRDGFSSRRPMGFFGEKEVYGEPPDPAWQEAWRITEELIVTMRNEVVSRGAKFLLVVLSTPIQVHPDSSFREQWKNKWGAENLFYPNMRLQALAEREGIPMLDLAIAFHDYAAQCRVFLHGFSRTLGDGHFNEQGHRLAGKLIARKIGQDVGPGKMLGEKKVANGMADETSSGHVQ